MNKLLKVIRRLVSEGYKLKAHHNNPEWKNALQLGESLLIDKRTLNNLDDYYIDELIDIRLKARKDKNWELADKIRNYTKSVIIIDNKDRQEIYYLPNNQTREYLVNRIKEEKRLLAQHDALLYSITSGTYGARLNNSK